jgi:hypothetical protein
VTKLTYLSIWSICLLSDPHLTQVDSSLVPAAEDEVQEGRHEDVQGLRHREKTSRQVVEGWKSFLYLCICEFVLKDNS